MCARQSWHQPTGESPVRGNRAPVGAAYGCDQRTSSRYRVLREVLSRGRPRSVDREYAGRNATSVKVSSPETHSLPWWPSTYEAAKATPAIRKDAGTTGVQVHGMYTWLMSEPGRSPTGGAHESSQCSLAHGQGMKAEFRASAVGEANLRRAFQSTSRPSTVTATVSGPANRPTRPLAEPRHPRAPSRSWASSRMPKSGTYGSVRSASRKLVFT